MALRKRRPGLVYPTWEDWHYVGDTDEPAFQNSWVNFGSDNNLAFRIRETGIVDIQGDIIGGTALAVIFTLPTGYRPSSNALYSVTGLVSGADEYLAATLNVTTAGDVSLSHRSTTPPDEFFISAQFFLTPSSAP